MSRHNQLLSGVTVRNLAITGNGTSATTASVQLGGSGMANTYGAVTFLVNYATGGNAAAQTVVLQQSGDNSTWSNVTAGYQVSTTFGAAITSTPTLGSGNVTVAPASGVTTANSTFLAISFNHPGRETGLASLSVPLANATQTFLRLANTGTGTPTYAVALLHNAAFTPVPQPDINVEVKATN